jgi:PAS domain S-box-containing protein
MYERMLDAAVAIMRADFGSIQMLDHARQELLLLGFRGFHAEAARFWERVHPASQSTCGLALRTGERVVVTDLSTCGFMAGSDDLATYLSTGIRAVQSTPLVSRNGVLIGMISTHWRTPHQPTEAELRALDILARQAADLIERKLAEEALRASEERFRALATASSDVVYRMSPDWTEMWHLRGREFIADTESATSTWLQKYIHPDDQQHVMAVIQEAIRTRSVFQLEHRIFRADGSLGWTFSRAVPIFGSHGEITEWFGAASDVTVRKLAEEALRGSEQRLRALADSMPQLAWTAQPDGYITWYNRRWYEYTGTTPEQMEGWGWQSVHDPEALPDVLRRWRESIATGTAFEMEFPLRGADGNFRRFLTRVFPLRDSSGNVTQWFGTNTDVTVLIEAQETLAVVTRLYAVLSRVNEAIVRTRDERILYEEVCRIVAEDGGFPLVWVGLVRGREVVPVAWSGRAAEYLREMRVETEGEFGQGPTGTCIREDHPEINDDFGTNPATWPWREATARHGLRASAAFPLHQGGAVIGALTFYAARPGAFTDSQIKLLEALCADISYALDAMRASHLRAEAEIAQRESDERFRAAFEASPDAININRMRDGAYVMVNDGFTRLSGWTRREVIGKTAEDLSIWADPEQRRRMIERLVAGELIQSEETAFRKKDGSVFSAAISAQTFEAGGEEFLLAITRDVSDVKRVEAALLEADRRKDEFLAMLSHELRNPLAPIRNSAYILRHADLASGQASRAQRVIERQTEHLTRLVDDLLDVTRIARGKIEIRRSRVDLREVAARAADDFRGILRDRGVSFDVAMPDTKVWADADATRITQIIGNLLHNASKFTRRGDKITLALAVTDSTAEIRVRDSGVGIDAAILPSIFDPFVQGDRTLARTEGGLGLGLALVQGITALHGGSVGAESAGDGKGAEFTVRLPLLAAIGADTLPEPHPEPGRRGGRRVLVVDDNVDAAESLADIVRMVGHYVDVANDGPSAIEKVRISPPDVVLCDIGLPGMSGYEVARRLRASGVNGTQLIAVSGYAQPEDVERAIEAGFDGHLAKPCDPEQIERLLA